MEERESSACRDGKDEPPPPPPYVPVSLPFPVVPAGMSKRPETYVVHFPRDQVYRVPPPENARIAERHRPKNNNQKTSSSHGGCSFCRLVIIALILVALGISIFIAMVLTLYSPKYPEFSVKHFHARSNNRNSSSSRPPPGKNDSNYYSVSLRIKNPNERMEVQYGSGKMSLKFKGKVIASGKYLSAQQEAAKEIVVLETLHGTKKPLPTSMVKSLNTSKDKHAKSMVLKISVPITITSWAITSQKYLIVTCDFKIKTLSKTGTKILSQECGTKH